MKRQCSSPMRRSLALILAGTIAVTSCTALEPDDEIEPGAIFCATGPHGEPLPGETCASVEHPGDPGIDVASEDLTRPPEPWDGSSPRPGDEEPAAAVCVPVLIWVGRIAAAVVVAVVTEWVISQSYLSYAECTANLWQCDAEAWTYCHQNAPPGKRLVKRTHPDPVGYCSWHWGRFPVGYYATCFAVECEYECIGAGQEGDCANRECANPNPECCEAVQKECVDCES